MLCGITAIRGGCRWHFQMSLESALSRYSELQSLVAPSAPPKLQPAAQPAVAPAVAPGTVPFAQQLQSAMGQGAVPATPAGATDWNPAAMDLAGPGGYAALGGIAPAGASYTPTMVTGDLKGLDSELLKKLDAIGQQLGQKIDVVSGFRSRAEQEELYRKYLNGTGNLAAPPGSSNHEHGDAADVYVNGVALASVPGGTAAAAAVGIGFPVGGEPWHAEMIGHKP